ncbi:hypothetical protein K490DRAFT_53005 [Saccharata proteae CBS 121410]|uniref:Uncharacterized protein n=1 Tax=Saccharata proteae CBS 121410 TaxID=1314787 RepID=A0A9P4HYX0_9PEZI|nr:hypothetical protein K490DRAFT_53005 [Saccharata proteae CBS 121410]
MPGMLPPPPLHCPLSAARCPLPAARLCRSSQPCEIAQAETAARAVSIRCDARWTEESTNPSSSVRMSIHFISCVSALRYQYRPSGVPNQRRLPSTATLPSRSLLSPNAVLRTPVLDVVNRHDGRAVGLCNGSPPKLELELRPLQRLHLNFNVRDSGSRPIARNSIGAGAPRRGPCNVKVESDVHEAELQRPWMAGGLRELAFVHALVLSHCLRCLVFFNRRRVQHHLDHTV